MKTIFDKDETSVTTFEESDGKITLTKHMDAQPIIDANRRDYNNWNTKSDHSKDGLRHVARIPHTIWSNWMKETNGAIEHDQQLLYKYLNDSDNKYFRTNPTIL